VHYNVSTKPLSLVNAIMLPSLQVSFEQIGYGVKGMQTIVLEGEVCYT